MGLQNETCYRMSCDYPGCDRVLTVDRTEWHRRESIIDVLDEYAPNDGDWTYRVPGVTEGMRLGASVGNPFHPTAEFRCDDHPFDSGG